MSVHAARIHGEAGLAIELAIELGEEVGHEGQQQLQQNEEQQLKQRWLQHLPQQHVKQESPASNVCRAPPSRARWISRLARVAASIAITPASPMDSGRASRGSALRIVTRQINRRNAPLVSARHRAWWKFW